MTAVIEDTRYSERKTGFQNSSSHCYCQTPWDFGKHEARSSRMASIVGAQQAACQRIGRLGESKPLAQPSISPAQRKGNMFAAPNKDFPTGSSSHHHDRDGPEGCVDSKKGSKPSLAERNRDRQQRFRQRQKSRIEELESRCARLTSQARSLVAEKEELAKNVALLKNLVQVRDLQLVAVTSQLAQYLPNSSDIKAELPTLEGVGSVEAYRQQQPVLQAIEALQAGRFEVQAEPAQPRSHAPAPIHAQARALPQAQAQEGPSSTDTESHEPLAHLRASSPISAPQRRSHSPQLALDQLCRVAEIAEMQRAESSSPASCKAEELLERHAAPAAPLFARLSSCFEGATDVVLHLEGQRVRVHSAFLAAHSNYFAKKFQGLRHSQPLFPVTQEPLLIDTGVPGKRVQDMQLFLCHCYGNLDLGPVADADIMRLVMLADEFEAAQLLRDCDEAIAARAHGKRFSFFVDLSSGGDVVDWIRLADRLGLKRVSCVCEMHLARYLKENRTWRENVRLNELGQECLLRVINKLAEL